MSDLRNTLSKSKLLKKVEINIKSVKNKQNEFKKKKKRRAFCKRLLFTLAVLEIVVLFLIIKIYC